MKPNLVVLAAGIGSRYGGLKQMDPVGPSGELIIDYSVYDALRAGFGKLTFVIREDIADEFKQRIGDKFKDRAEVAYVFQSLDQVPEGFTVPTGRTKPWGTGHAVLAAREVVAEPFGVINADDFYGAASYRSLYDFLTGPEAGGDETYAIVGFRLGDTLSDHGTVARGICSCDPSGLLLEIEEYTCIEKKDGQIVDTDDNGNQRMLTGDEFVSMNMWGFPPSFIPELRNQFARFLDEQGQTEKGEFYIPWAVDQLIRTRNTRTRVLPVDSEWFGVTYQEDKPTVVKRIGELVAQGTYPEKLWDH